MKTTTNLVIVSAFFLFANISISQQQENIPSINTVIDRHLQNNMLANTFLSSPNNSYYLCYNNTLYKNISVTGDSWDKIAEDISEISIDPKNENIVYAINKDHNVVKKSMNGGIDWIVIQNGLPSEVRFYNKILINPHDNSEIFLTAENGIYKTSDAGFSWQPFKIGVGHCFFTIHSSIKDKYYLLTLAEGVNLSSDGGITWNNISNTLPKILVKGKGRTAQYRTISIYYMTNINYPNSSFLLAFTEKGIYKTTNDGKSWDEINNGFSTKDLVESLYLSNDRILLGCGEVDKNTQKWTPSIYKSDIYATKWEKIKIPDDFQVITGVYKEPTHSGIFFEGNNKIAYLDSNLNVIGLNYGVTSHSIINAFNSVEVYGTTFLYAIVENNNYIDIDKYGLWWSTNNGISWKTGIVYSHYVDWASSPLQNIFISPYNSPEIWLIDNNSKYVSYNGGTVWTELNDPLKNNHIYNFSFDPKDSKIIYASLGVNGSYLYRYDKTTSGSTQLCQPGYFFKIAKDNNKNIITANFQLTNDGGWTWKSIRNNFDSLTKNQYQDARPLFYEGKNIIIATDRDLITSNDEGNSWNILKSFDKKIRFISINPNDSNNIILITDQNNQNGDFNGLQVLQTTDRENWETISQNIIPENTNDANKSYYEEYYKRVAFSQNNGKKIIYLFGNVGLLSSEDNGKTWKTIGGIHEDK